MKLNTDNRDQMPITDAVYGSPPKRTVRPPKRTVRPGPGRVAPAGRPLWRLVPEALLEQGGRHAREFAARRRKENG